MIGLPIFFPFHFQINNNNNIGSVLTVGFLSNQKSEAVI